MIIVSILAPGLFVNINNNADYIITKLTLPSKNEHHEVITVSKNKGNIIIMMDDGFKSQYTVGYKYMNKKSMRGSIAVITNFIGRPGYLNEAQLYRLHNDGWDLLNHTHNHKNLRTLSYQEQLDEINESSKWLEKKGYGINNNILIYPYGSFNEDTIKILKEFDFIGARGITDGFNNKTPDNPYNIKVKNVLSNIEPQTVYKWIDYTQENNLTLILLFHKLEPITDSSLMQYEENKFYEIIDYVDKKREKLNIITFSQWLRIINNK